MDATLVRGTLVPAFMRLAGDANWWAPAPLRRLHDALRPRRGSRPAPGSTAGPDGRSVGVMPIGHRKRRPARRGRRPAREILVAADSSLPSTGSDEAVSVRAVADRVGVSTPSIYLHFADKDALIDAVCESVFADLGQADGGRCPRRRRTVRGAEATRAGVRALRLANPEHYRIVLMSRGNAANSAAHMLKQYVTSSK